MSLPKPYYEDKWGVIYCADCRLILPELPKVDLVLTDPPYGIDYQSAWRIDWQRKEKIQGDSEFPLWIFDECKANNALLVFCRWDILIKLPAPTSFIVWDKERHSMGNLEHEYGRQWEGIAFYPFAKHQFIKRPKDIIHCPCVSPDKLMHPNEKPVSLICQLLSNQVGDIILDPFLGSGTTAVAAKKLNRHYIGIEISEKYCAIAARRLSQDVMELKI